MAKAHLIAKKARMAAEKNIAKDIKKAAEKQALYDQKMRMEKAARAVHQSRFGQYLAKSAPRNNPFINL